MRSFFFFYILPIFLFSCTGSTSQQNETEPPRAEVRIGVTADSLSFVGSVKRFASGEYYADLYAFEFPDTLAEYLRKHGTLISEDAETRRIELPEELVKPYFDLSGMATIAFFNEENGFIGRGVIHHFEWVSDLISSGYSVVFSAPDMRSVPDYVIGNAEFLKLHPARFEEVSDTKSQKIQKLLGETINVQRNYTIESLKQSYSVVNTDSTSYIIRSGQSPEIVFKSADFIGELRPLAIRVKGEPVFLASCGRFESDVTWESLLVYNGRTYEEAPQNRLRNHEAELRAQ